MHTSATGEKLEKKVINGVSTITDYLGGYQYKNATLEFFPHAEGYLKNTAGMYSYVFNYTDHLGNVRVSYSDLDKDGSIDKTKNEILEESNYYPFGLKHEGYNTNNYQANYKYKYNGKELQDELGLNMYDYGARNYDAAIGRFMNIDRLAEKFETLTPYQYAGNTPTYFIDVNGEYIYINDPSQDGKQYRYQNGTTQHKVDGKWVDIDGNANLSSFVLNTVAGLYHLENSGETGKGLVNHFSGSENDVTFQYQKDGVGYKDGVVSLDHRAENKNFVQNGLGGSKLENTPYYVTIGHEMGHATDPIKIHDPWYKSDVSEGEIRASHIENKIRAESGLPLRTHYGMIYDKKSKTFSSHPFSTLIDREGNSVYYNSFQKRVAYPNSRDGKRVNQMVSSINDGLKADGGQILNSRYNYNGK